MTLTVTDTSGDLGRTLWLSLRHASDQSSRILRSGDLEWHDAFFNESSTHKFTLNLEPTTRPLHLVFSANRSRVVDFIVAPP